MTVEEIKNMSDEEMAKLITLDNALTLANDDIKNKDAEISSLKKELDDNKKLIDKYNKELQETKELNFTLARQFDTGHKSDIEETINDMFK